MARFFAQQTAKLQGWEGINRGPVDSCLLTARCDIDAIQCFLHEYVDTPETHRAYTRDISRFQAWAARECDLPISSVLVAEVQKYKSFLHKIPTEWMCRRGVEPSSEEWRPFTTQLSADSIAQSLGSVQRIMGYLARTGYLKVNPFDFFARKKRMNITDVQQRRKIEDRTITNSQRRALINYLDTQSSYEAERARFIISMLFFLGLRINELEHGLWSDFEWRLSSGWWYTVRGAEGGAKGGKWRKIPVPAMLVLEIKRWRTLLDLSSLPQEDEKTPIIRAIDRNDPIKRRRMRDIVKKYIIEAAKTLNDPKKEEAMVRASAHWFRHAQFTAQKDHGISPEHSMKNAGHADMKTTLIYRHVDEQQRHREVQHIGWTAEQAHVIAWGDEK